MSVEGYAYITDDGTIDIKTVSATETAVMVNAIVTVSGHSIIPMYDWNEEKIREEFSRLLELHGGRLAKVVISVKE